MARSVLLALLLTGCTWSLPEDTTPQPLPPPPPVQDGGVEPTCETACGNVAELDPEGGCGVAPDRCMANCSKATAAEAEQGVRFPVACLTAATSCPAVWECK